VKGQELLCQFGENSSNIDKFEKPAAMEGLDECDAADQVSIQRAEATMNVSRGNKQDADEEPSEKGWDDNNTNGGTSKDEY
jgi:hypothetical protein